jgi:hypothetical protein
MMADGRVLEGTAKQIADSMRALAVGQENRTLSEYIDWAVDQARRMNEIDLDVAGATDDDKASALVRSTLAAGLAQKLRAAVLGARRIGGPRLGGLDSVGYDSRFGSAEERNDRGREAPNHWTSDGRPFGPR